MALNFVSKNASVPNPPEDVVYFSVSINREQCDNVAAEMAARLDDLEVSGFEISLTELIATAGAHFRDGAIDFSGYGKEQAEIQRAWDNLAHCQPRAVYNKKLNKNRFVVTKSVNNPRADGLAAEILAVGVGLAVATRFYSIPLQGWSPTGLAPTDFEAYDSDGNLIKVEVRGRFARKNWKTAIEKTQQKLKDEKDFNKAMGVLFAPRESAMTNASDIEIIDPSGDYMNTREYPQLRSILCHYAPFFERQNYSEFAARLRELSDAEDASFARYLNEGDIVLGDKNIQTHRTFFRYAGHRFEGTAWAGTAWPTALTGVEIPDNKGCFYWALWEEVTRALREGRLRDIAEMRVPFQTVRHHGRVLVLLQDGMALVWAPTEADLSPSMFEN
jgi:hypothetical protein